MDIVPAVLVVDDEIRSVEAIELNLEDEFRVLTATSAAQALELLENEWIGVVISDQRMPGMSGVDFLTQVRERWPDVVRILITGYTDVEDIVRSVNESGIYQFIAKPWHPDELILAARNGLALNRLQHDNERLMLELRMVAPAVEDRLKARQAQAEDAFSFQTVIRGAHSSMNAACALAEKVAGFDIPVLIQGETGTGKSLIARGIHYGSPRQAAPFFAATCTGLSDEALESELFGHRKGAFVGATESRVGLFEQAHGGTVLLHDIADISPTFQMKLMRFLKEGEIRPFGSNIPRTVNVRILAATRRDLKADVAAGLFREDLYYRLAVSPILLPPLRDRREDIAAIATELLQRATLRYGKPVAGFTREALAVLRRYAWPGNIRELENQIARMLMLSGTATLGAELIDTHILHAEGPEAVPDEVAEAMLGGGGDLKDRVERMEARILRETLIRHRWNKSRAAEELGLSRVGLRAKLDRYGISDGRISAVDDRVVALPTRQLGREV
ncbi:hypothetical protein AEAC466_06135 [Asticcacaulis sp. AC466]|uniref:sigma-54-dependent transcriptional regulator n=1 Tax=Asticcacaulis sp. AC466 TaxID=1282362 RepID=UPI0003C3F077|nr:sigma-54 dependent transcriptional regulator [Asticcacaulis sp. AC466]ESQ85290.1 hypothetical protein AEAC466_06135 [Asticcacaulis sp. AC466]